MRIFQKPDQAALEKRRRALEATTARGPLNFLSTKAGSFVLLMAVYGFIADKFTHLAVTQRLIIVRPVGLLIGGLFAGVAGWYEAQNFLKSGKGLPAPTPNRPPSPAPETAP